MTSAKLDRLVKPTEFFAGDGEDPTGLRSRVTSASTREKLGAAVGILCENGKIPLAQHPEPEILGRTYCLLKSSKKLGQFFTPATVSRFMAQMGAGDIEKQVLERARAALIAAGREPANPEWSAEELFGRYGRVFAPYFEEIRFLEPACGAGSMLLAFAAQCPGWAIECGAVTLTAIDLDPRAVQMARINCLVFEIRAHLFCGDALSMQELKSLPEPYGSRYSAIRLALSRGDVEEAERAAEAVIGYKPEFKQLEFDLEQGAA